MSSALKVGMQRAEGSVIAYLSFGMRDRGHHSSSLLATVLETHETIVTGVSCFVDVLQRRCGQRVERTVSRNYCGKLPQLPE